MIPSIRVIPGCFALAAFAVAIISGLAAHADALAIIGRALLALVVCYPIGIAAAAVCQRALADAIAPDEVVRTPAPAEATVDDVND